MTMMTPLNHIPLLPKQKLNKLLPRVIRCYAQFPLLSPSLISSTAFVKSKHFFPQNLSYRHRSSIIHNILLFPSYHVRTSKTIIVISIMPLDRTNSCPKPSLSSAASQSPHHILRVLPTATRLQIKEAYKARLLQTHPDKPGGNRHDFDAVHTAYHHLIAAPPVAPRSVIADTISLADMFIDGDHASFACRCGDAFLVPVDHVCPPCVIVACLGCSLSIRVVKEDT